MHAQISEEFILRVRKIGNIFFFAIIRNLIYEMIRGVELFIPNQSLVSRLKLTAGI